MNRDHLTLINGDRPPEATLRNCYQRLLALQNELVEAFEGLDPELHDTIVDPFVDAQHALNALRSKVVEVALHTGEIGWVEN